MDSLQLINTKKEFYLLFTFFIFIFILNIILEYHKYKDFTKEEIYSGSFQVVNIYEKENYNTLKLKNSEFSFFTSISKNIKVEKLNEINITIISTKINFMDFLKGFYTKSLYVDFVSHRNSLKKDIYEKINKSHQNTKIQELFNALFLAIPISKENRAIYTDLGISHLIAISGFHLAILSFIIYWSLYYPYKFLHKRYFIYRNIKADISILTMFFLLLYLGLSDIVPSLLRAFIMLVLAFLFLRSNIKVFSFNTLLFTLIFIVVLFPKYIFSISMWFSVIGVFYIFLYIEYFKNLPKIFSFVFFNFWIFFVFNPIVHYFFSNTSYEQLISPFITLLFTIFYPFELVLHIFGLAHLLDKYILILLEYKIVVFDVFTPKWFFILYVISSIVSIFNKKAFILLNIFMVLFNLYLYL